MVETINEVFNKKESSSITLLDELEEEEEVRVDIGEEDEEEEEDEDTVINMECSSRPNNNNNGSGGREEDFSSGVSMPSSPETVIDKRESANGPTTLTRVLLEWIFSLRHQLVRSKSTIAKLQAENDQLKQKADGELVQFLSQLQRDAQRVNRAFKAKDARIVSLKVDCNKLSQENAALRKQLDSFMQALIVSPPCTNCHPIKNGHQVSTQQAIPVITVQSASKSFATPPTPTTPTPNSTPNAGSTLTSSPSNVSSSSNSSPPENNTPTPSSAGARFGKGIMSSLKLRLGKLGSSSRKLKIEHREKFRSVDVIIPAPVKLPIVAPRLSTPHLEEEKVVVVEPVPAPVPVAAPQPLQSSPATNKVGTSRPPAPRPRKNRVCISDPPAFTYNMVASAQAAYAAKSCGDIISLSEEAELENSVSPLVMSDSCHHFIDSNRSSLTTNSSSSSIKGDSLSDERENDSSPEDEEVSSSGVSSSLRRHSSTVNCETTQPSDDIKRCFGTRQTRYSRRKFDFKRRYSSTYFIKPQTLPQEGATPEIIAIKPNPSEESPHTGSSQLVRSRSSPSEAIDHLPKLRSKLQQTQLDKDKKENADSGSESATTNSSSNNATTNSNSKYQTSPRMVGSHSFAGREVLVV